MPLQEYHRKRDFQRTREPRGEESTKVGQSRFIIQKHDASRLHYDFRLELGGTLKSWAVPKGLPLSHAEKRLAMQVEDHPVEYADFEGIIPKGQYGGGTVMLWDRGRYQSLGGDPQVDLDHGKLHFALEGTKLKGEWTLVRMSRGERNEWLLIKSGEDHHAISKTLDDRSCATGRSMAQIARQKDASWTSAPGGPSGKTSAKSRLRFIPPMKATLVKAPPKGGQWEYELKFDGYRALALKHGRDVRLVSRNDKEFSSRFPEIAAAVAGLGVEEAILDGEIVALDAEGRPTFQLLQSLDLQPERPPLAFYLFDLLRLDGEDLTALPLHRRREKLHALLANASEPLRYSATIGGAPEELLAEVKRRGLEGLIGKVLDSPYQAGRRSRSWVKLKCVAEQEFVIGGYTPPEGARHHLGALIVGVYERGRLRFSGKVGTGFTEATLAALHHRLQGLARDECPFVDLPEKRGGRWSQNITPAEMKRCHWVAPSLVAQVKFTEWTEDGKLRHPVFLGLREDKDARGVQRERPAAPPA